LHPDSFDTVIVRFGGEIGIKAPYTRKQYERRLANNIKAALKHYNISYSAFVKKPGRLYIKTHQAEETAQKIHYVFGVSSLSPAIERSSNLDDIINSGVQFTRSKFAPRKSFAVRCRRVGKHLYTSQDLCARVGEGILASLPKMKLHVDLKHPEQTLQVEVRDESAYLFNNVIKGVGGLPLGTQPKLVCLLKGDVSSAVACWMTMKRGCPPILVHFADSLMKSQRSIEQARRMARILMNWNIGFPRKLRVFSYNDDAQKICEEYPLELAWLVRKRVMLRTAERIAETMNAEGIVTGDTLGKKATQTIHSFRIQDEAVKGFPVYRPLIGLNEAETAETAQAIGMGKSVKEKVEHMESEVKVKIEEIKKVERSLRVEKLVDEAVKSLRTLELYPSVA